MNGFPTRRRTKILYCRIQFHKKKKVISAVHLYIPHSLIIYTCDDSVHRILPPWGQRLNDWEKIHAQWKIVKKLNLSSIRTLSKPSQIYKHKLGFYLCFLKQDFKRSLRERQAQREDLRGCLPFAAERRKQPKERKQNDLSQRHIYRWKTATWDLFIFFSRRRRAVHFLSESASCERVCEGNVSKVNNFYRSRDVIASLRV